MNSEDSLTAFKICIPSNSGRMPVNGSSSPFIWPRSTHWSSAMLVISFVALPSLRTASSWRGAASGEREMEPDVLLYISLPDITI